MNKDKLRAAIIGCGNIAEFKYMSNMSKMPEVEMVAFCDIDEAKAVNALKKYGTDDAKHYTDYRALLEDKSIDVVHVCTPHGLHAKMTVDALDAGKHVMSEKPMACTAEQARSMVEAAGRSGKKLTIGLQHRFKPEAQYLHEVCRNGKLGEIFYARAIYLRRRGIPAHGDFTNKAISGGGALLDAGSHALDLTLWLMNNYEVKSVTGTIYDKLGKRGSSANKNRTWDPEKFTVEDTAFAFIVMKNGATVTLEASWAINNMLAGHGLNVLCGTEGGADTLDGLRINGEEANKLYDYKPDLSKVDGSGYPMEIGMHARQVLQWYNCLVHGGEPLVKPEEALVVTEILDAVYRSAETGKTIYF